MKIYIAAPYPYLEEADAVAQHLRSKGHIITSRWLKTVSDLDNAGARMDLEDIDAADVFLALNPPGWANIGTGGRHVELGYALAKGKKIILAGERTNVFHYHSDIMVERWEDL